MITHAQTTRSPHGVALVPVVAMSAKGNTRAPAGSGKSLCGDLSKQNPVPVDADTGLLINLKGNISND